MPKNAKPAFDGVQKPKAPKAPPQMFDADSLIHPITGHGPEQMAYRLVAVELPIFKQKKYQKL